MTTPRTQEEIMDRIGERREDDPLAYEISIYTAYLSWDNAKKFMSDTAKNNGWEDPERGTREHFVDVIYHHMAFAWEKANGCRGESAARTVAHLIAWLWLYGDDNIADNTDRAVKENYCYYGKPILAALCNYFGWNPNKWDDGIWRNSEDDEGIKAPVIGAIEEPREMVETELPVECDLIIEIINAVNKTISKTLKDKGEHLSVTEVAGILAFLSGKTYAIHPELSELDVISSVMVNAKTGYHDPNSMFALATDKEKLN